MFRRKFLTTSATAAATVAVGMPRASRAQQAIVVGGKNFTEQQIIAEMTARYLTAKGIAVDKRVGLGTAAQGGRAGHGHRVRLADL